MARDPFEVLGIARDATLEQAHDAYRRTVELFHPDRLRQFRDSVQAEGERRLREATEAMHAVQRALGGPLRAPGHEAASPHAPSDAATAAEARFYDAVLRELDHDGIPVPGSKVAFGGPAAEAVLAALRHEFRRDEGPIRMVEWGSYRVELPGGEMLAFLHGALGIELVDHGGTDRRAIGNRLPEVAPTAGVPAELKDAIVHLRHDVRYALTADVY
jgi:hypothetical protein